MFRSMYMVVVALALLAGCSKMEEAPAITKTDSPTQQQAADAIFASWSTDLVSVCFDRTHGAVYPTHR